MSSNTPVLKTITFPRKGKMMRLDINAGLHYIASNRMPYFSVTADLYRISASDSRGTHEAAGCLHEEILRKCPSLADLVAMHLSDIDGQPMHAESNGWYQLAGALGGMGEQYHAATAPRNFPITPDPAEPWKDTEQRLPTADECLDAFAAYVRIDLDQARKIARAVYAELGPPQDAEGLPPWRKSDYARARAKWAEICASMRPRWEAEAQVCIEKVRAENLRR